MPKIKLESTLSAIWLFLRVRCQIRAVNKNYYPYYESSIPNEHFKPGADKRETRPPLERQWARRPLRYPQVGMLLPRSMIAKMPGDKKIFMGNHL